MAGRDGEGRAVDEKRGYPRPVAQIVDGRRPGREAFARVATGLRLSPALRADLATIFREGFSAGADQRQAEIERGIDARLPAIVSMVAEAMNVHMGRWTDEMKSYVTKEIQNAIRLSATSRRLDFSDPIKLEQENFLRNGGRGGLCPGCRTQLFGAGGAAKPERTFDHNNGNAQCNKEWNCWILCNACNTLKANPPTEEEIERFADLFRVYRRELKAWRPPIITRQATLAEAFRPAPAPLRSR